MKGMKLSVKIIGGFAIILTLMLVVIGIYQFSSNKSSSGFNSLINGDVAVLNHAGETESFMLQARRNEKDFLLRKDLKYLDKHAESIAGIIDNAAAIVKLETSKGDLQMANEAAEIITLAQKYRQSFEELVAAQQRAGLDYKSGLQGEFRAAAGIIGSAMPEHDIDNLLVAFLQIRRYEKDYLRSLGDQAKSDKYKAKFSKALAEYESLLNNSPCDPIAKKSQQQALADYKAVSTQWLNTEDEAMRNVKYDNMRASASLIEDAIESVQVSGATALMLDIRKQEKDYLLRLDPKYITKVSNSVQKLRSAFAKAGIIQEHINATNEQLDIYMKAFNGLVAENQTIADSLVAMKASVHEIEPLIENIHSEATKETHITTNEITEMSSSMSRTALLSGGVTMFIGIFLSFFISRSITGPIKKTVDWMTSGAEQVSAASGQVSSSSQSLAEGASEQAAAIEETSASMEEISSMTKQNADNASQANSLMREAIKTIERTDQSMDEMSKSMENISSASEETSKIIKTIDEIAFQTNLLALNAAVEAARAGEAGAGFAVVADEVRNLAMRATEAAKNTADLIEGTIQQVNIGKEIVIKTNEGFKEVATSSNKVGGLVEEITSASQEQSQGLTQINQAITLMDNVTQQNSATAEESAAASEELSAQADSMMEEVKKLKDIVDGAGKSSALSPPKYTSQNASLPRTQNKSIAPAAATTAAAPAASRTSTKPEDIIPMGGDDDFEDF